jgi:uncharacterized protein
MLTGKAQVKKILWVFLLFESILAGTWLKVSGFFKHILTLRWLSSQMADPAEFGLSYSLVSFPSRDGLMLRGWWFATAPEQPVIIILHGIAAHRAEPAERVFGITRELIDQGYNILTFDFRGHGESEGEHTSAGLYEKNDLLGAIDFIRKKGISGKIGVLGFSMGAAISLLTAAESQDIAAVVADSSFVDIVSILKWKLSRWSFLSKLIIPFLTFFARLMYRFDITGVKPLEAIRSISVPVFIIHGGRDRVIPVEHAYRLKKACKNLNDLLWVVPEANHTGAFFIHTEEYLSKVINFFHKAFAST